MAITFDSLGVTGATTYQNEALSMYYVSNGPNFHGSGLYARKCHLKFFRELLMFSLFNLFHNVYGIKHPMKPLNTKQNGKGTIIYTD